MRQFRKLTDCGSKGNPCENPEQSRCCMSSHTQRPRMSLSMLTDGKIAQGDDESEDLLTHVHFKNPAIDRRTKFLLTQYE